MKQTVCLSADDLRRAVVLWVEEESGLPVNPEKVRIDFGEGGYLAKVEVEVKDDLEPTVAHRLDMLEYHIRRNYEIHYGPTWKEHVKNSETIK